MKIIKSFLIIFFFTLIDGLCSAENNEEFDGKGGREDLSFLNAKNSNFKKGKDALKQVQKLINKNKTKKANKRLEDAIEYFILANDQLPNNVNILSYLGLSYYLADDPIMSEIYYMDGLSLDPENYLINAKLAELYLNTKKIELAKERLNVLKSCNCQEYSKLKDIIEKNY